jgi:hypothetical protein
MKSTLIWLTLSARLLRVAAPEQAGEIVKRALAYPYPSPERSFVQLGARSLDLPEGGPELSGRAPLLAYGANAAPVALTRKLAPLPDQPLPVLRAELEGFDVVYSAHLSPYGAVPATLRPRPGTVAAVFVAYPTAEQRRLLTATEPNYELETLSGISCRLEGATELTALEVYLSRHGELQLDGAPIALTSMAEPEILELVRSRLFPELTLEGLVLRAVEAGGIAPLPTLSTP